MIERAEIDGRPAIVTYLNDDLEPVAPDDATLLKVIFTDDQGGSAFLKPVDEKPK
jgi:hypothetical protein